MKLGETCLGKEIYEVEEQKKGERRMRFVVYTEVREEVD